MSLNLRNRMLLLALMPAMVVAALLGSVFVLYSIDSLEQQLHTRGAAISRQISVAAEYGIFSGQPEILGALTEATLRIDPDARGVAVLDVQGGIIARTGDLHRSDWSGLAKAEGLHVGRDVLLFVEPVISTSLPVDDIYAGAEALRAAGQKTIGHVVVEMSRGEVSRKSRWLLAAAVLLGMLAVALGAWLALGIARAVTRPLREAGEVVTRIGTGDLKARMKAEAAGPLKSLATGINDMAGRIGVTQEDLQARVDEATSALQREKQAAESATTAKSHFLAAASHDLRQPLHALGLFVSGLAQSKAAKHEPQLVEHIRESVDILQNLLNAILDVSRLDHGNLVPEIGNFDMGDVLDRLAANHSLQAKRQGLRLKLRTTRFWVRSDQELVERILLNLVGNALRYTGSGGVLVGCRRRGDGLRVEVWDTGDGIPEHAREEIFQDYVQLGNAERDRAKGLGLGLAICRRLAALLAIQIGVSSRPGRGSLFWIELPLAQPEVGAGKTAGGIPQSGLETDHVRLSGTVLVVEGDALVRAGMEQAIIGWGAAVILAATRQEALHRCREGDRAPDLVICNLRLPGRVSGIELAEELQREFEHMAFLLISADTSEEAQAAARRAGFALLKKPVPAGRLRAALRQLLAAP